MKLIEMTCTVKQSGELWIPADVLRDMNVLPGEQVTVAYLTRDGQRNDYQEFLISTKSAQPTEEVQEILLPSVLLEKAGLEGDVQILCLDGGLLICRDPTLRLEEWRSVMEAQSIALDLVSRLDRAPMDAARQLQRYFQEMAEEETYGEEGDGSRKGDSARDGR